MKVVLPACLRGRCGDFATTRHTQIFLIQASTEPSSECIITDYEAGLLDSIVCYDMDRLTRQPRELEDWIDRAEQRGLLLVTANGDADLSTDGGRMYARIKVAVAHGEVEQKGARQSCAQRQRAEQGRPPKGCWMALLAQRARLAEGLAQNSHLFPHACLM